MPQQPSPSPSQIASKRRHLSLLQKVRDNKTLSSAEVKELDGYEKAAQPVILPPVAPKTKKGARIARLPVNLAAQLKLAAANGLTTAGAEAQLNIKSFNEIFKKKPELKKAWERGRFLRNLAECSASAASISDAEHELNMPAGELEKIFLADKEAADVWNQSLIKTRNFVRKKILERAEEASPAALKQMYSFLSRQIVTQSFDDTHISTEQIMRWTGLSRVTLQADWPKKYGLPRNKDGTFNISVFFRWLWDEYIPRKPSPGRPAEPEELRSKKAKMLEIDLRERMGQLLDRTSVITGLTGRHQLMLNSLDKLANKLPDLVVNQPPERIRKILKDSFAEMRNDMADSKIELKLDEKRQKMLKELLAADPDEIVEATSHGARNTEIQKIEN